jgi:hypothetical protein
MKPSRVAELGVDMHNRRSTHHNLTESFIVSWRAHGVPSSTVYGLKMGSLLPSNVTCEILAEQDRTSVRGSTRQKGTGEGYDYLPCAALLEITLTLVWHKIVTLQFPSSILTSFVLIITWSQAYAVSYKKPDAEVEETSIAESPRVVFVHTPVIFS